MFFFFSFKELATLKAKELYQTMEKAQELAQGSKQEQHVPDLAQKAHDISKLQNNLGSGKYKTSHTQFACSFGVRKQVVSGVGVFCFCFPVCI